jgi:heptosyltransferase-2
VWPLKNFQELVRRLRQENYSVQIACDGDQLQWWRDQGENASAPQTVTDLLACLDGAGVFIGNDSGPGHLAASCGLPTFTLFGPQLPEWFAPMHPAAEWVEGKACPYKPCSDYCRYPAPYCLWNISTEEVWPRVQAFARHHLGQAEKPF